MFKCKYAVIISTDIMPKYSAIERIKKKMIKKTSFKHLRSGGCKRLERFNKIGRPTFLLYD